MRLARAARAAGNTDRAVEAFSRVVYEFPFGDLAPIASSELKSLPIAADRAGHQPLQARARTRRTAVRRQALHAGARRVRGAAAAAQGDDRELVQLRLAECDYFLKRPRNARDGVRPYIDKAVAPGRGALLLCGRRRAISAITTEYLRVVRRLVNEFPTQSWAEEALNNLATHYILQNDDESADETFRELYEKFPDRPLRGARRVEDRLVRRTGTAATPTPSVSFESAAAQFPRSDYRPPWLYWSAQRARSAEGPALADAALSRSLPPTT